MVYKKQVIKYLKLFNYYYYFASKISNLTKLKQHRLALTNNNNNPFDGIVTRERTCNHHHYVEPSPHPTQTGSTFKYQLKLIG